MVKREKPVLTIVEPDAPAAENELLPREANDPEGAAEYAAMEAAEIAEEEGGSALEPIAEFDDRPAIMTQKTLVLMVPQEMADEWQTAANVHEEAQRLIQEHELEARRARIAYFWKRKGGKSRGKNNMGGVTFLRGATKVLARYDAIVWIAADHHENLATARISATILHQLLRIREDEETSEIRQRYEDFGGFNEELDIVGAYTYELAKAKAHFEQAAIPEFTVG